jgi:hypothetical protein
MDFLILIKNGCDSLTATVSPSVDSLGLHMVIALATIMLVWCGVQEALASAQGWPRIQPGQIPEFLRSDHIRILLCEVLRQFDTWHRVLA